MPTLDAPRALQSSQRIWDGEIVPALYEYIRIPNKAPAYDPRWQRNMDRAVALIEGWCRKQPVAGLSVEVLRLEKRTPVIFMEVPGQGSETVLLYGHLDKQPEMSGWRQGLSPWAPLREGDKLYGRGGADDGYASFASLAALRLVQEQNLPHARCVVLIEACEESGSTDLPAYITHLAPRTGKVKLDALQVQIPNERLKQARLTAEVLGDEVWNKFPFVQGARPVVSDKVEMILNRSWRPALAITGVEGLPPLGSAGNVLRPYTACKISLRIPPRVDPAVAMRAVRETLEKDPPSGSRVTFEGEKASIGWDAPPLAQWLASSVDRASRTFFGKPPMALGEGGSIPFMGMLGERFPEAQFLITGVLGPGSNAHGPNEFLHIPTGIRLTACVASVIADHFAR